MSIRHATIPQLEDVALRAANRINLIDQGLAPATPDSRPNAVLILERVRAELDSRHAEVPASARERLL
jgi:hypothetical protein